MTRIQEWKSEVQAVLETCESRPKEEHEPQWYAGLAVSPASFSQQLADMQVSLQRANTTQSAAEDLELVKVRSAGLSLEEGQRRRA